MGEKIDETTKVVEGQKKMLEETRAIIQRHQARAIQAEESLSMDMGNIYTGLSQTEANMMAIFPSASRGVVKRATSTSRALDITQGRLIDTVQKQKEEAKKEVGTAQAELTAEMTRDIEQEQGVSTEKLRILMERKKQAPTNTRTVERTRVVPQPPPRVALVEPESTAGLTFRGLTEE